MELAGKQIGNYVAKAELGSGGMGVVYLCEHPLIRRRVAAKVLHEELAASEEIVRRLFAEAKAANEIASEHIIEVLDFGRMDDNGRELVYLIMEFLEGEGLGHRLWRVGLTIDESLHIVSQCCEALVASHKAGIVHRDLKPENIFLLERRGDPNFVKILDFGIAKVSGNPSTKTRTGVLLGTPAYMSPEQCRGSGSVDARADVYSLGIVLYELCTGDVPFNGDGYGQVLLAQMTERPRPPTTINTNLPKAVEAVIMKALEKDPDKRYQTMAEFGRAIADAETFIGSRPPISQIPRKGLHQRETLVRNGHRSSTVARALDQVAPTPHDAQLKQRMSDVAADAKTQLREAPDADTIARMNTLQGAGEPASGDALATVVDQRLPTQVRAAIAEHADTNKTAIKEPPPRQRSEPATKMSRDGAGNLTTGPQGMVAPKVVAASNSAPTVLAAPSGSGSGARTVLRPAADDAGDTPARSSTGRVIVILLVAILVGGAALFLLR